MLINNMSFKELPLMEPKDGTVLFYPYISKSSFKEVKKGSNWSLDRTRTFGR